MKKKILFLCMTAMFALCAWAETPEECYRKHPNAMCFFFKTPSDGNNLGYDFDIERVAFEGSKVYIKTAKPNQEFVKIVKNSKVDGKGMILIFQDDTSLMMLENGYLNYLADIDKGKGVYCTPDVFKFAEFEELRKSADK